MFIDQLRSSLKAPLSRRSLRTILLAPVFFAATAQVDPAPRGEADWSAEKQGEALDLGKSKQVFAEEFSKPVSLDGPVLFAKQHADYGRAGFDPPGGAAYAFRDGALALRVYSDGQRMRGANVQSVSSAQSYTGAPIVPGRQGFTCAGCYWEARLRFPEARGTWGGFWLLTPDDPRNRGHLEVDVVEYYGIGDERGLHHSLHRWRPKELGGHTRQSDYVRMPEIADFGWHTYGVDLRGSSSNDAKQQAVFYVDGKEVRRVPVDDEFLKKPFYFLNTLTISAKKQEITLPQELLVDYVRIWH